MRRCVCTELLQQPSSKRNRPTSPCMQIMQNTTRGLFYCVATLETIVGREIKKEKLKPISALTMRYNRYQALILFLKQFMILSLSATTAVLNYISNKLKFLRGSLILISVASTAADVRKKNLRFCWTQNLWSKYLWIDEKQRIRISYSRSIQIGSQLYFAARNFIFKWRLNIDGI